MQSPVLRISSWCPSARGSSRWSVGPGEKIGTRRPLRQILLLAIFNLVLYFSNARIDYDGAHNLQQWHNAQSNAQNLLQWLEKASYHWYFSLTTVLAPGFYMPFLLTNTAPQDWMNYSTEITIAKLDTLNSTAEHRVLWTIALKLLLQN